MTLQEKFLPFVDWIDLQDDCTDRNWALRNANKCEEVADDFAIEFLEFTESTYSFGNIIGKWYLHSDTSKEYTKKELLEIYKKEKGW